jgi:hypothetical protein
VASTATPVTHRSAESITTRNELDAPQGTESKSMMLFSKLSIEDILTDRENGQISMIIQVVTADAGVCSLSETQR